MHIDSQNLEDLGLGGPHLHSLILRQVIVSQQMQDPMHDQQLQFRPHVVAGRRCLSISTMERDDHIPQIAWQTRRSDERPVGLIWEGQHVGRRIHVPMTEIEFVQRFIPGHNHSQLARPLHPLVDQGRLSSLTEQFRLNLALELLADLDFYAMGRLY